MMKNATISPILALFLTSCATYVEDDKRTQIVSGNSYEIRVIDNPQARKFEIEFGSIADKDLCIEFGEWPHVPEEDGWPRRPGSLHFMSDQVYVLANGEKYPIKKSNFGLCETADASIDPRACSTVVEPRMSISSAIPYGEFEGRIPTGSGITRELVYDPRVDFCDG